MVSLSPLLPSQIPVPAGLLGVDPDNIVHVVLNCSHDAFALAY